MIALFTLFSLSAVLQGCGSGSDQGADQQQTGTDTTATTSGEDAKPPADQKDREETIQNKALHQKLEKMISAAENGDCSQFADHLVYTGDDEQRKYKEKLNMQNETEQYRAESTCQAIGSWLSESNDYQYGSYRIEGHQQLDTIYRQEIAFMQQAGSNRRVFTFLKSDGQYLLMNIQ